MWWAKQYFPEAVVFRLPHDRRGVPMLRFSELALSFLALLVLANKGFHLISRKAAPRCPMGLPTIRSNSLLGLSMALFVGVTVTGRQSELQASVPADVWGGAGEGGCQRHF